MMRSLWISKTGMEAQQTQLDAISHNLANVSTNGYKRSHVVFEDLMYQNMRQAGANSSEQTTLPTGLQVGLGARAVATSRSFTQGNLQQSSNPLDLAVLGNGFFEIQMPDGTTGYTRDGSFQVNCAGAARHEQRLPRQPGHHDPEQRHVGDDRQRRHGQRHAARPVAAAVGRADPARRLRQPRRPRAEGPEPVHRDRRVRHAQLGRARAATAWARCARVSSRPRTSTWSRSWSA